MRPPSEEQDNKALKGSLWGTNVSPGPTEKETSRDGEVEVTDIHSSAVLFDF